MSIDVEASGTIKASREAIWRHLTRVTDWYRWYPGLHGTTEAEPITHTGQTWRSTGQMGRMLYRGTQEVTSHKMLDHIVVDGSRHPWMRRATIRFELAPDGANARFTVRILAEPGFWFVGRLLLAPLFRGRLQTECDAVVDRLTQYVEGTMPYH